MKKVPWFYDDGRDDYYREVLGQGKEYLFQTMFDIKVVYMFINNTVEIIEEDNNKIEYLNIDSFSSLECKAIGRRVNKIIDKINNME